jgi:small multidrug resistance pump
MQGWLYLFIAIVLEVAGTTSMKLSEGFTKTIPSVLMFLFYILSLVALTFALRKFDVSMAYAIWAGLGTALITVVGIVYFKESVSLIKIGSIVLIIIGVVGLQLSNKSI